MIESFSLWRRFDYILFAATMVLVVFGILMIASATQDAIDDDIIRRVPDQINFAIIGFIVAIVIASIDYRLLGSLSPWLYAGIVALLAITFAFGVEGAGGAKRWLNIGIRIQPSEIGKIILIITLSQYIAERYLELGRLATVFRTMAHVAIPSALIFAQPDLGTTIVFLVIWAVIIWSAGLRLRHIALFLISLAIILPIIFPLLRPYQRLRVELFISPELDPDAAYNINQARISIGSGGLLGKGYAVGPQNTGRFLRVRHTDFIFSVIAHEFGMVGGLAVLAMFALVLARILKGAREASDPLGSMICYGVAAMIFFQTTVSIGMNLNLMPVTGLTLPFVSSGGTSLLFTMVGIGLVESVIVRRRRIII
ncbi:MAG: FtsW/RodA/SpoVE family cell cycle protein [Chloroflexota bacterium]|nr:FtsW/RodA/SpoVE family cell cycle protein [Chloroflexota bacterium]MDE2910111.1 FtsW/RodA/SpoVE family cell cycle protein [Chloroflexota bacterium]